MKELDSPDARHILQSDFAMPATQRRSPVRPRSREPRAMAFACAPAVPESPDETDEALTPGTGARYDGRHTGSEKGKSAMSGRYDGIQWGELVRFQTQGLPGEDGPEGLPLEEQLLDLAAFLSKDAGYFAARAQAYFHQARGRAWGGTTPREVLLQEMRRSLAYFLGHLIMAAKYLEADVLEEFVAWSEELGVTLPEIPFQPLPGYPPYPAVKREA